MKTQIRFMTAKDWEAVRQIYLEGIASGQATFELDAPSWEVWDSRHLQFARLIASNGSADEVIGWAALAPVSTRPVYAGVAEVSIYVASAARGHGIGRRLLTCLIAEAEKNGIWTLQASIFPENRASLTLHRKCGFRRVGKRVRIAQLGGVWRDTILIERRSKIAGQ